MKRQFAIAAVVCLATMGLQAQTRPDFSGTWEMDMERTRAANGARSGGGGGGVATMSGGGSLAPSGPPAATVVTITQTTGGMKIERVSGQVFEITNFKFDGTEAVTVINTMTRRQKSRWEGNKLISEGSGETVLSDGSGSVKSTFKEVRWIDKDGGMVVESTRAVQPPPGTQLGDGGAPRTSMQYFKKK